MKVDQQIVHFLRQNGWDKQAIQQFQQTGLSEQLFAEGFDLAIQELCLVGSPSYEKLFRYSSISALEKVRLVLKHLGAFLDEYDMLQLQGNHTIDKRMAPHSRFLRLFAQVVKQAYPKGLINVYAEIQIDELKMVHQLRHFIDLQNIYYIRKNFEGQTDYEKLCLYEKISQQKLNYRAGSQFHNRVPTNIDTIRQYNDKITTQNGLSEFILDIKTGAFISQWNQLKDIYGQPILIEANRETIEINRNRIDASPKSYSLSSRSGQEIANTESFNYDAGYFFDLLKKHHRYDMRPGGEQKFDSQIRKAAKKKWRYPKVYKEIITNKRHLKRGMTN